jgi:flagellar protein FliL
VKGKLKIILPVLLVLAAAGGGAYFFLLAPKPAKAAAPPKVQGELFPLSPEFVVNLSGGHYGKVSVALVLTSGAPATAADGTAGTLPEDVVVRSVITNDLTGLPTSDLIDRTPREALTKEILKDLQAKTDVKVTEVLFTDVVVQ